MPLNSEDQARIAALEAQAAQLRELFDSPTTERPFVIEFSGAPKAGKTRLINVLELFLKRNGIKAEVFTERASIAPIRSKGHLNFNIWVSCASLQGMLEALYQDDIDVFILDRGVFDALVWNEWLEMTGKITHEEASQVAQFFTMKRWTDLIDLIFVITCDPQVSIEREYADQLTTKRGTIMAEDTLNQFKMAADATMETYGSRFQKIVTLDTTHTVTREAAVKIAGTTLGALGEFLDENICVIAADTPNLKLPDKGFVSDPSVVSAFTELVNKRKVFVRRSEAEQNANQLQPIPCAILRYEDKVLVLKRKKKGHPLHDSYAIWAGGHVSQSDDGADVLLNALYRELNEELFIRESYDVNPKPVGLVRTNEDPRASRHVAVLYEIELKSEHVALALNQKEFRSTRGTSMSGKLVPVEQLREIYDDMGDWARSITDHYWPQSAKPNDPDTPLFKR